MSSSSLLPDGYAACHAVIGDAINRCRRDDKLSRVTVVVKYHENSPPFLLSSFEVLVSDTGPGISCDKVPKLFQAFSSTPLTHLCGAPLLWGGEMILLTTEFWETEVRQYEVRDAFNQTTTIQLRSLSKESAEFSGSSIVLRLKGYPKDFILYICDMCSMIKILMPKSLVLEVCVERQTSKGTVSENVLLVWQGLTLAPEFSTLDRLGVGIAAYATSSADTNGVSPKIGKASVTSSESSSDGLWCLEACFAITESPVDGDSTTNIECRQTKVLFFQDFICSAVPLTIAQTLKAKVNWDTFGLHVKDIHLKETGAAIIEWGSLSRLRSVELALHRYRNYQTKTVSWPKEVSLCKRCIERALNDLKRHNPQLFMSCQSTELRKYALDLSICLSKLISSSRDKEFKGQGLFMQSRNWTCNLQKKTNFLPMKARASFDRTTPPVKTMMKQTMPMFQKKLTGSSVCAAKFLG